ncbi:MAG TPA: helix-turn-helix domain-containing protein [Nocardioidaceae bacterium]|nr:helix-turn-helix domain-containing protein [Nocardioidaceae bacterium]
MTATTEKLTLLTIDEVAEYTRLKVETVRWLRQQGRFAPASKLGRQLVWDLTDVNEWVQAQRERAA